MQRSNFFSIQEKAQGELAEESGLLDIANGGNQSNNYGFADPADQGLVSKKRKQA